MLFAFIIQAGRHIVECRFHNCPAGLFLLEGLGTEAVPVMNGMEHPFNCVELNYARWLIQKGYFCVAALRACGEVIIVERLNVSFGEEWALVSRMSWLPTDLAFQFNDFLLQGLYLPLL